MLRIFIGFDPKEIAAYQVCSYSIIKHASEPVSITPVSIRHLPWFSNADYKASTEFAFTRFMVPYLSDYQGLSVFMDCDMLVLSDIANLFAEYDGESDVQCVQHDYIPKTAEKFLGARQTQYKFKNWSSVMLFNNERCKSLSPNYVDTAGGLHLHQFEWAGNVGALPASWNHLVGEYENPAEPPNLLHYTLGGPYFTDYADCAYADLWWQYWNEANSVLDIKVLNGLQRSDTTG